MTEFPDTQMSLLAALRSPENREAWETFVEIYRPLVYRMARRRGLQDADAQDVTQEILARVAAAIEQYESRPGVGFRHWLRRVARNAIFTALSRRPGDQAAGGTEARELLDLQAEIPPEIEQELNNEYQREQFLRAAAFVRTEVNAETWQAFERTVILGGTCEEVADELGKSVGTIYAARSRIIKRLRDQVERLSGDDSR